MQQLDLQSISLEDRLGLIVNRLRFFPSKDFLKRFTYGSRLLEASKEFGGLDSVYGSMGKEDYFQSNTVEIPSPKQQLAATEIVLAGINGKKRLELSKPRTRKTLGVLSAIPIINEIGMEDLGYKGKVKTLICCPTYIISTWIRESERLLKNPNIVVVTRRNRVYSIKKAQQEETDIVLLGYELSHRKTGVELEDPEILREMSNMQTELLLSIKNKNEAYERLELLINKEKLDRYKKRERSISDIIKRIVLEDKLSEVAKIAEDLKNKVFNKDRPYYVIYDEVHNIVDPDSQTAIALADLFTSARWGSLVTGTGIRNRLENLAYPAYLVGRIQDPKEFRPVFKDNTKIVKAMFDLDANQIRTIKELDPEAKDPIILDKEYNLSSKEMDLYLGIINSDLFEGRERYLLLNYLLINAKKLLPENFKQGEEESIKNKLEKFFQKNDNLLEYAKEVKPSRLEVTKEIIRKAKEEKRKVIIACEYSTKLTEFLEEELKEFGSVRIDQRVSAQPIEIPLSKIELDELISKKLFEQGQKFRSDLSLEARKLLNISTYEIWDPSQRELALLEALTNPENTALVVTYGTLREGIEATEVNECIEYDPTTVPSRHEQLMSRMLMPGKRDNVLVHRLKALSTFEESKYKFRDWKSYLIKLVFEGEDATPEELEALIEDTRPEKYKEISNLINLNSRSIVALMFNNLRGQGLERFVNEMSAHDNALFLAKNYNYEWSYSYSSNCARLATEIVLGLENKIGEKLEDILDLGCGPATISRTIKRKATCLDVNRFQLDYGIDACEELNLENEYLLGSYTDLNNLIKRSDDEKVFDPKKQYTKKISINEKSKNLSVCSLALDFATEEERKQFFTENKRIIKENGYLMIIEPTSKIEEGCKEEFLKDMEEIGFEVDKELTGKYKSRRTLNIDTREYQKNGFEAYVIIAKNKNNNIPNYIEDKDYFRMLNDYNITEGNPNEGNGIKKETKIRRYECGDFLNIDTNIDPKRLKPKEGDKIIHPELLEIQEALSRPEDIGDLLEAIEKLAEK